MSYPMLPGEIHELDLYANGQAAKPITVLSWFPFEVLYYPRAAKRYVLAKHHKTDQEFEDMTAVVRAFEIASREYDRQRVKAGMA